jgi:hypothetical protein
MIPAGIGLPFAPVYLKVGGLNPFLAKTGAKCSLQSGMPAIGANHGKLGG